MSRISLSQIARAAREIDPVFLATPQFEAPSLGRALGVRVLLKDETNTPIRSFKGRGADFFVRTLQYPPARLVCASAGNFGQGLAWAARSRGVPCDVFAAVTANPLKVQRMRALGANVQLAGDDFDAAKAAAKAHADRVGVPFIEDGKEVVISEGAGSIAVEMSAWPRPIDVLFVPLGNGALLGGMATWVRAHAPHTRIVGVCASGAPSMERSFRDRRVVETARADTIADGIAVRVPIPEAVADLLDIIDDVVLVDDREILSAMRLLRATEGMEVEPGAAVGLAPIAASATQFGGQLVATVLTGANVTDEQRAQWFE